MSNSKLLNSSIRKKNKNVLNDVYSDMNCDLPKLTQASLDNSPDVDCLCKGKALANDTKLEYENQNLNSSMVQSIASSNRSNFTFNVKKDANK